MQLIGAGRDCDVFDLGDGTVLRRRRDGLVLGHEVAIMRHARAHGFPCPEVIDTDGADLILERIDGPTMLQALIDDGTTALARGGGRTLAELHARLHGIPPIGAGDGCLVHLDLHPANVLLSPSGPVLIDWTNARDGRAGLDLAMTWVILAPAVAAGLPAAVALLESFLDGVDRDTAEASLGEACALRLVDENIDDAERAAVSALLDQPGR